jgi:hypothetical protein
MKAAINIMIDETIKYTNELLNYCSGGIANRHIALIKLRSIVQKPVPNIIAPIYFGGKMPPRLLTLLPAIPNTSPNKPRIGMTDQSYPDPCGENSDTKGNSIISTELRTNIKLILRLKETILPYDIVSTVAMNTIRLTTKI